MFNIKNDKLITIFKYIFFIVLFCLLFSWSLMQNFGLPPDESERYKIVQYIINHGKLPHGGDPEIMLGGWGFSYGFQPILSYIFSAFFVKFSMLFTDNAYIAIVAARFFNVILGVIMAVFVFKIGFKLFKDKSASILFTLLVCLLPQAMFMHTYVNTDSMALLSSAIIVYAWIIGLESKWSLKSIITLAIGLALCALSYYNAYGFILCSIIIFIYSFIDYSKDPNKPPVLLEWKPLIKKGLIAALIAFLLAGWWFIRSAVIYDGDFLGLSTRDAYAEIYAADHLKPSQAPTFKNAGFSMLYMLRTTNYIPSLIESFVGMFEHMSLSLEKWEYIIYYIIFAIGIIGMFFKQRQPLDNTGFENRRTDFRVFNICMLLCIIIPNYLCLVAAYSIDYQPQGRYILPMLIPFMYFIAKGIQKLIQNIFNKLSINDFYSKYVNYFICLIIVFITVMFMKNIIFAKYFSAFYEVFKGLF